MQKKKNYLICILTLETSVVRRFFIFHMTRLIAVVAVTSVFLAFLFIPPSSGAETKPKASSGIYKWIDEDGQVHFSTSKLSPDQKPADLPKVKRENLDKKIEKLRDSAPESCVSRGDVDCSLGPDSDGSVICLDGYRDALLPFRFRCLEVKLRVDDLLVITSKGPDISLKRNRDSRRLRREVNDVEPVELQLIIRNMSDVKASNAVAFFKLLGGEELQALGPEEVEPFGVAEYKVTLPLVYTRAWRQRLVDTKYKVRCANCRSTINTY